jgi:hypothetical protein
VPSPVFLNHAMGARTPREGLLRHPSFPPGLGPMTGETMYHTKSRGQLNFLMALRSRLDYDLPANTKLGPVFGRTARRITSLSY